MLRDPPSPCAWCVGLYSSWRRINTNKSESLPIYYLLWHLDPSLNALYSRMTLYIASVIIDSKHGSRSINVGARFHPIFMHMHSISIEILTVKRIHLFVVDIGDYQPENSKGCGSLHPGVHILSSLSCQNNTPKGRQRVHPNRPLLETIRFLVSCVWKHVGVDVQIIGLWASGRETSPSIHPSCMLFIFFKADSIHLQDLVDIYTCSAAYFQLHSIPCSVCIPCCVPNELLSGTYLQPRTDTRA